MRPVDEAALCDGTAASIGDTIVTRRNERRLALTATDWVKNGDRWTVTAVYPDGSLRARHHQLRRSIVLPTEYVRDHVQLGYAATVHAAQGQTTDTCHTVVSGEESRQLLYVALSRGRSANHLYLATADDGDPHNLVRREALLPPTAIDVLTTILQRDGSQHSATSTQARTGLGRRAATPGGAPLPGRRGLRSRGCSRRGHRGSSRRPSGSAIAGPDQGAGVPDAAGTPRPPRR